MFIFDLITIKKRARRLGEPKSLFYRGGESKAQTARNKNCVRTQQLLNAMGFRICFVIMIPFVLW